MDLSAFWHTVASRIHACMPTGGAASMHANFWWRGDGGGGWGDD